MVVYLCRTLKYYVTLDVVVIDGVPTKRLTPVMDQPQ
jgi:hypothetical protein